MDQITAVPLVFNNKEQPDLSHMALVMGGVIGNNFKYNIVSYFPSLLDQGKKIAI